jgi:hypothetical protein
MKRHHLKPYCGRALPLRLETSRWRCAASPGFKVVGGGTRVMGQGFRVQGPGFRVVGSGFAVPTAGGGVRGETAVREP